MKHVWPHPTGLRKLDAHRRQRFPDGLGGLLRKRRGDEQPPGFRQRSGR
jgi:hypothetical protein